MPYIQKEAYKILQKFKIKVTQVSGVHTMDTIFQA